ncbi:MAG: oligosaccharide repeat unit polymerase [Thermoleophilia bacterium]|nr:oligosaccharide repeat unit polymerase [Thermoleophilia bacterium]
MAHQQAEPKTGFRPKMILFCIIFMASLAAFNFKVTRILYYPPTFFAALWAALLFALFISGDFFYPISDLTLVLYSLGVFMFSMGGLLVFSLYPNRPRTNMSGNPRDISFTNRFLDLGLLVLLLAFPFYWRYLQQIGAASGFEDFWIGLRTQTGSGEQGNMGFGIYAYLTAFSTFISLAAYYVNDGTLYQRFRAYALIAVSLTYHVLTVSRLGAMITIFGIVGVTLVRYGRIRIRSLIVGIIIFVLIFSVPALLLNKGGSRETDISENVVSLTENFKVYVLGGLVAMDEVVIHPESIESNWRSLRFFITIANRLGSNFDLGSSNLDFTLTPLPTNVYTIYFPYFQDYGWAGTAFIMFILGAFTTRVYILAINGDPQAAVLFGLIFGSLILSCASDLFMISISYWIQAYVFTFLLFKLPLYWRDHESIPSDTFQKIRPLS